MTALHDGRASPFNVSENGRSKLVTGLTLSIAGHFALVCLVIFKLGPQFHDFSNQVVYSVTVEGGKRLGAMSQVPKVSKASVIAPPKNVSSEVKIPPPNQERKIPEEKKEPDKKIKEKPEVSLHDKPKPVEKVKEVKKEPEKKQPKEKPKPKEPTVAEINKELQSAMQRYLGESSDAGGQGFGAAKLGGKGMGGGEIRPPEFFTYLELLRSHIKRGWRWYDTSAALKTWITFEMAPDGTLTNVSVAQSSGNQEFDQSVFRAVQKANPAPPPPEKVYEFFRSVRIAFDPRE